MTCQLDRGIHGELATLGLKVAPPPYGSASSAAASIPHLSATAIDDGSNLSDGALFAKSPSSATVYLVSNGVKREIASAAVFDKYSFDWDKIVTVNATVLEAVPNGPVISS